MAVKKTITKKRIQEVINEAKEAMKNSPGLHWISENSSSEYCVMRAMENLSTFGENRLDETIALLIIAKIKHEEV